jgi:uncharacterized protein YhaN
MAGILMIAVQALEKRTGQIYSLHSELKKKDEQIASLESTVEQLKAKQLYFETMAARLDALELRQNQSMQAVREVSRSVVPDVSR